MDQFLVVCLEHLKDNTIMSKFLEGLKGFAAGFADPSAASQAYFNMQMAPVLSRMKLDERRRELLTTAEIKQAAEDAAEEKLRAKEEEIALGISGGDSAKASRILPFIRGGEAIRRALASRKDYTTAESDIDAALAKNLQSKVEAEAAANLTPARARDEAEKLASEGLVRPYRTRADISKARAEEAGAQMDYQTTDSLLWGGGARQKADQLLAESQAATEVAGAKRQTARQQRLTSAMTTDEMKTLRNANAEQAVSSALSKLDATQQAKTIAAIKDAVIRKAVVTAPDGNVTGFDMSKLTPDERMLWNQTMGILRASGLADLSDADIVQSMLNMLNTGAPATGETFKDDSF